jgi:hypothetical protein
MEFTTGTSRNRAEGVAIVQVQYREPGLANTCCVREHRFEHRLQLAGRAADDLQHLGRCCQLFQRIVPLTCESSNFRFLAGSEGTATTSETFALLRRFNVLRRCVFTPLPSALPRRLMPPPWSVKAS